MEETHPGHLKAADICGYILSFRACPESAFEPSRQPTGQNDAIVTQNYGVSTRTHHSTTSAAVWQPLTDVVEEIRATDDSQCGAQELASSEDPMLRLNTVKRQDFEANQLPHIDMASVQDGGSAPNQGAPPELEQGKSGQPSNALEDVSR